MAVYGITAERAFDILVWRSRRPISKSENSPATSSTR